jgi:hypothetical protein
MSRKGTEYRTSKPWWHASNEKRLAVVRCVRPSVTEPVECGKGKEGLDAVDINREEEEVTPRDCTDMHTRKIESKKATIVITH